MNDVKEGKLTSQAHAKKSHTRNLYAFKNSEVNLQMMGRMNLTLYVAHATGESLDCVTKITSFELTVIHVANSTILSLYM